MTRADRSRRASLVLPFACIAALAWPPAAPGATDTEVALLLGKPCPARYMNVFQRAWSPAEQEAALRGEFPVLQDWRATGLVPPVDWEQDPYRSLTWRHWLHTLGWWMDALFFIDREGGPDAREALGNARDLTLDWIASNPIGPPNPNNPPWAPKPTADRSAYLAYLARRAACQALLTPGQGEVLLDSLRAHADYLIGHHPRSSKGLWSDYGLALTGHYLDGVLAEAPQWRALAIERFPSAVAARLEPTEVFWLGNSPNYNVMLSDLVQLFHDNVQQDPDLAAIARGMRDAAGWFVHPDGGMVRFGDYHTNVPIKPWVERAGAGKRGFHFMARSGFAFVKRPRSYLAVESTYHVDSHKHADDLNFELSEHGRRVITDSGHHDFDRSRWEAFAKSTEAHNVLTVDGKEFPLKGNAYGSGLLARGNGDGWFAVLGRNPNIGAAGVRHRRLFLYRPAHRLLVIDLVRSSRRHVYRRHLQVAAGVRAARTTGDAVRLSAPGLRARVRSSGDSRPRLAHGEARPLRGWYFPDTDRREARSTLTYRSVGRNADLLTEIGFSGGREPLPRLLAGSPRRVVVALRGRHGPRLVAARSGATLRVSVRR